MAIFVPDYTFDGMTAEQAQEILGVLGSLEQLLTKEETELLFQQTAQKFAEADIEILPDPIGHVYLDTGTKLAGEYIGPAASTTETALDIAQEAYDAAVLDKNGSVIYRYSTGQGAMGVETAGQATKYQTTSLMSLDLGMVGAAVAPLLGVALGVGLEEANPEFWTKLSMKLLPFCYPGTTQIPAWLDIVESALVPDTYEAHGVIDKAIYDTIKAWFDEEGYGNPKEEYEVVDEPGIVEPLIWREAYEGMRLGEFELRGSGSIHVAWAFTSENAITVYCASDNPAGLAFWSLTTMGWGMSFFTNRTYTKDGKTCYVGVVATASPAYFDEMRLLVAESARQTAPSDDICWALMFGTAAAAGTYPQGTSAWGGDSPALEQYEKSIIHFNTDPVTGDVTIDESEGIEITLQKKKKSFEGDNPSYSSPDPNHEPSPNQTKNPQNAISNLENTAPGNNVNPEKDPQPDPDTDPSKPTNKPTPTIPVDPPGTPGIEPPPPDDGITPASVIPYIPLPFSSSNDGLISVYHPTDAQLKAFASWLWVTYADPSIEKLWNNPFDGVIGLMELYCTPTDNGTKTIRSGFLDSGISSATISRYTEINCGTIFVPEYYNNYFDYSPYSKCHVYLPFVGIVELNVDDIVGHGVNITYKIDEYNGSCIAQVTVAKYTEVNGEPVEYSDLMYQFSGNCAVELPLAGGTQSAIRAGMIQAAAYGLSSAIGGIVSGAAGNIGGAISGLASGAAGAISSLVSAKSSVQHSGSFGSSFGALGCKIPFITITRPKQLAVYNYPELYGYPAHCAVTIGACTGFLRVREVNVRSATASDEEKMKIEEMLKAGVYV